MTKHLPTLGLLLLCFAGCNDAAKQYQTNQAQNAAKSSELKELGEAMHNEQASVKADGAAQDDEP